MPGEKDRANLPYPGPKSHQQRVPVHVRGEFHRDSSAPQSPETSATKEQSLVVEQSPDPLLFAWSIFLLMVFQNERQALASVPLLKRRARYCTQLSRDSSSVLQIW